MAKLLIDVTAADNRTAWAVGHPTTIIKTMDGGVSWQIQMAGGFIDMNGACAIDKYNAWTTRDYGNVYWTSDGGKTWNVQSPTRTGGFYLLSVSARTLNTTWVVGGPENGMGGGKILHTINRGVNWTEQFVPVNVPLDRVSFVGTRS